MTTELAAERAEASEGSPPGKTAYHSELLFNRLSKRYRHLKKWVRRTGTNAFRLYDKDIPEIPLVLDIYDDAVSGAVYKRPAEGSDEAESEIWLSAMKTAAAKALEIPESRIFLKERRRIRHRQETGDQYDKINDKSYYKTVIEGNLKFRVNLSDYLDTGLFLDGRKKRALIRTEAEGKRVLNLFAYTCSLSVAAAIGGANQVDSVDLSNTYLEWGKLNFALNGLSLSDKLTFIRNDVLQFLDQAKARKSRWDIIILDPPSFSNSKKMLETLDIRRDYRELMDKCLTLLSPGGTLYFSTNAKGFRLRDEDCPGFIIKDLRPELTDEDFREKRIPACYKFSK
jgi:23S rRNA G2069 N7-methylase RlmK/C1962 C5-methylase RlmI